MTWRDLSDDELRARLAQHHPELPSSHVAQLVADRDDVDGIEVIDGLLDDSPEP